MEYYLENSAIQDDAQTEPDPIWLHWKATGSNTISLATYTTGLAENFRVKAFATKGAEINVMVMNHDPVNPHSFVIDFTGVPGGAPNQYFFVFAAGVSGTQTHTFSGTTSSVGLNEIGPAETLVLTFGCDGTLLHRQVYNSYFVNYGFAADYSLSSPIAITSPTQSSFPCLGSNSSAITITNAPTGSTYSWIKLPATPLQFTGNTATGLKPGIYRTDIGISGCSSTVSLVNVIHETSPLVDAGPDAQLCNVSSTVVCQKNVPANFLFKSNSHH